MYSTRLERRALEAIDVVCFPKGSECLFPDVDYAMSQHTVIIMAIGREYFGKVPYLIDIMAPAPDDAICLRRPMDDKEDEDEHRFLDLTDRSKLEKSADIEYFVNGINQYMREHDSFLYNFYDKQLIFTDDYIFLNCKSDTYPVDAVISKHRNIPGCVRDLIVKMVTKDESSIKWLSVNNNGMILTRTMTVRDVDIEDCYNDDLPLDRLDDLLSSDGSELIVFRGKPGTGKSTLIRHLINKHKDINFYWLDVNMFARINDHAFQSFLIENKRGVYILEDCESILKSRDSDYNVFLASLLNLSDGMLGDSLSNKFICTFNTDLSNIDKAVLRKGRLKLLYTFDDLSKDKCNSILDRIGSGYRTDKPMPLCEVFNHDIDNGNGDMNCRRVGF